MSARPPRPPGWYLDPEATDQERWWTGTEWDSATKNRAFREESVIAEQPAQRSAQPSSAIWAIALLPIVVIAGAALVVAETLNDMGSRVAASVLPAAGLVLSHVLVGRDYDALRNAGVEIRWSRSWELLKFAAYVPIRTVAVYRHSRTGLAPFFVWITSILVAIGVVLATLHSIGSI